MSYGGDFKVKGLAVVDISVGRACGIDQPNGCNIHTKIMVFDPKDGLDIHIKELREQLLRELARINRVGGGVNEASLD
jgi:hypothetical protein